MEPDCTELVLTLKEAVGILFITKKHPLTGNYRQFSDWLGGYYNIWPQERELNKEFIDFYLTRTTGNSMNSIGIENLGTLIRFLSNHFTNKEQERMLSWMKQHKP